MKESLLTQARLQAHEDQAPVEIWWKTVQIPGRDPQNPGRTWSYKTRRTVGESPAQTEAARKELQEDGWKFSKVIASATIIWSKIEGGDS